MFWRVAKSIEKSEENPKEKACENSHALRLYQKFEKIAFFFIELFGRLGCLCRIGQAQDDEFDAAVLCATFFRVVCLDGTIGTIADGIETVGIDAALD